MAFGNQGTGPLQPLSLPGASSVAAAAAAATAVGLVSGDVAGAGLGLFPAEAAGGEVMHWPEYADLG
jgi:hypothetical protein